MAARPVTLLCLGASCLFISLTHCAAYADPPNAQRAQSVPTSTASFDKDTRLNRLIDIQETAIPFAELLARYNDKELTLKAARDCAQSKLQIRLKQRSLRVLMQSLAELLPGTWTPRPDGSGYYFEMSARATQWREDWWRIVSRRTQKSRGRAARLHAAKNSRSAEAF